MKNILLIVLLLALTAGTTGCGVTNIAYNRERILSKYGDYDVVLNGEAIDLGQYWLDKRNIGSVRLDRERSMVMIEQKNPDTEYEQFGLRDSLFRDGLLVVIDGVVVDINGKVVIESSAIKGSWLLKNATATTLSTPRPVLILFTDHSSFRRYRNRIENNSRP